MMKTTNLLTTGLATLFVTGLISAQAQTTITRWDFNANSFSASGGTTNSPNPVTGFGTASAFGGTTVSFASGNSNGGSTDPDTTSNDLGWGITTFPVAGGLNKSAGVQFNVSTLGYTDIKLSFDLRHSNTSSRYERVQYSLDGINFIDSLGFTGGAGDTWFNSRAVDLTGIVGVANNASFAVRIVPEWESTATGSGANAFLASNSSSSYAASGTWRFDMVNISGTVVPEPTVLSLGAVGLLGLIFRQRVVARRN